MQTCFGCCRACQLELGELRQVVQQEALTMDKSAEQFRAALDHSVAGVNRLIVEP